jgi:hypothetical protein
MEYITKTAGVGDTEAGIGKVTGEINTIIYAHDTTLIVENKDYMIELIK